MRFGLFGSAQAKRGGPDVDSGAGFREFVERNIEAEALGYVSTFLVEHHFTGFGQVSASLNLLTWIGARTTTLRLGTAVLVLPWHNPVLLAEQVATLDLLSGGRVDFGIGKGYRYNEFAGFCIPMEDADARFDECVEVMTRAWVSDAPWSHHGKYWQFADVAVEPPTAQKPHPPLWMGAGSPASIKKVAALGYNLLLGQFDSFEEIAEEIALFKAEVEARGRTFDPMSVAVTRSLNIVTTAAEYDKAIEHAWRDVSGPSAWHNGPALTIRVSPLRPGRSTVRRRRSAPSSRRCATPARNTCCSTVPAASPPCAASRRRSCQHLPASPCCRPRSESGKAVL